MSYQQYGISPELVERAKLKLKDKAIKERIKLLSENITRADLQNRLKIKSLLVKASKITGISINAVQTERIIDFVISHNIDPKNTFHLIKLWGMFR